MDHSLPFFSIGRSRVAPLLDSLPMEKISFVQLAHNLRYRKLCSSTFALDLNTRNAEFI